MLLDEMIDEVRTGGNQAQTEGRASASTIASHLNKGKDIVASKLFAADLKYGEVDELISFIGGQEEYDIPAILKDSKVSLVERVSAPPGGQREVGYISFQDKERYHAPGASQMASALVYYLRGRKIGFKPIPTSPEANAVKLFGIQHPPNMLWFKAQAVAASAFVIPLSSDVVNMRAGRTSRETDYYKNAVFRAVSGANIGLERTCVAYNPTTRTVTLSAVAAPLATGDELVLLTNIPDPYHETLIAYAIMKVAQSSADAERISAAKAEWDRLYTLMSAALKPRHIDRPQYVDYPGEGDEEL